MNQSCARPKDGAANELRIYDFSRACTAWSSRCFHHDPAHQPVRLLGYCAGVYRARRREEVKRIGANLVIRKNSVDLRNRAETAFAAPPSATASARVNESPDAERSC